MRKLVKKLALVLALVMAIGCIAPASAQAAEKAEKWTWNFDEAGIVKPTKNMLVGETYKFQVLKYGEALDAEEYSVKYYAKVEDKNGKNVETDAVLMNSKSGLLVALEAAKDIKIAAVVKNLTTGGTAKVWAFLDVYAASELEIVASPSISLDEALELGATFTVDSCVALADGDVYDMEVSYEIKNEDVVTSEDGINFTVVGHGETEIVFSAKGLESTTLSVVVVEPTAVPTPEPTEEPTPEPTEEPTPEPTEAPLAIESVKQTGVKAFEITFNKDLEKVSNPKSLLKAKIAQKNSTIQYTTAVSNATIEGNVLKVETPIRLANDVTIYFTYDGLAADGYKIAVGKPADVVVNTLLVEYAIFNDLDVVVRDGNGTLLYTGKYSEITEEAKVNITVADFNGVAGTQYDAFINAGQIYFPEADKTVSLVIKSADDKTVLSDKVYSITSAKQAAPTESPYETYAIAKSNADLSKTAFGTALTTYVGDLGYQIFAKRVSTSVDINGKETTTAIYSNSEALTYYSTNTSVLLIDKNTGVLIPISEGEADVYIQRGDAVIAACTVTVGPKRVETSASYKVDKYTISNSTAAGDQIKVTEIKVKDQYTADMTVNKVEATIAGGASDAVKPVYNNGVITASGATAGNYTVTLKINDKVTAAVFTITVQDPKEDSEPKYIFDSVADYKANPAATGTFDIVLKKYDAYSILIGKADIAGVKGEGTAVADSLYIEVKDSSNKAPKAGFVTVANGKITINPFADNSDGILGTYTVTLYQYKEYSSGDKKIETYIQKATLSFKVVNGKDALTVKAGTNTSSAVYADVVSGTTITNAAFDVTGVVTGSSIDNALVDNVFSCLKMYIGEVKDGKELAKSALDSVKLTGFVDGTSTVVVSYVEVVKGGVKYTYTFAADARPVIKFAEK